MVFGKNINPRYPLEQYWIIGDVHGCIFTLENLIKRFPKDAIPIFVGDLVDKGRHSKEVMEFVLQNDYLTTEGNHEFLMYNYIRDAVFRGKKNLWLSETYGGLVTVKSYGNDYDTLLKHIGFIERMPKYLEIENYFITHGFGLPYYRRRNEQEFVRKLYTQRLEEYYDEAEPWRLYNIINVFGHTPYTDVLFGKNYIGIDTGCVYGGKLSALNLKTHRVISVNADDKDTY